MTGAAAVGWPGTAYHALNVSRCCFIPLQIIIFARIVHLKIAGHSNVYQRACTHGSDGPASLSDHHMCLPQSSPVAVSDELLHSHVIAANYVWLACQTGLHVCMRNQASKHACTAISSCMSPSSRYTAQAIYPPRAILNGCMHVRWFACSSKRVWVLNARNTLKAFCPVVTTYY